MKLPPDWSEFIDLLNTHCVRYVIVGAHALAANGRPRATQDIDFFVEPSSENAMRLGKALRDFGFYALADEANQFTEPNRMAKLGNPPLRIDILTSISGVTFDEAYDTRMVADFGEHKVGFLSRKAFIQNKTASGRPKDLADIALLEEIEID